MARRPQPGLPIFLVSAVACVGLVVAASVFSANNQFSAVRADFEVSVQNVSDQVKIDNDAHAQLKKVETSDFAASTKSVLSALSPCVGPAALTATKTALTQAAGFAKLKGAERVTLPAFAKSKDADQVTNAQQLILTLRADKVKTAQTLAAVQANLIAQDEVNQQLAGVATNVIVTSKELVSKNHHASGDTKTSYATSVEGLQEIVKRITPALKSSDAVKISAFNAATLRETLSNFASACKAEAQSNADRTPHMATISYPKWGLKSWPVENYPYSMSLTVETPGDPTEGCTSTHLLAEGIANGNLGQNVTVTVPNVTAPVYKVLTHYTSATSVQYAVVACAP